MLRVLWSINVGAPLRGLALARETGRLLAWDAADQVHVFDASGSCALRRPAPGPLAAVCAADDGSGYVAAGAAGEVWLLGPDLAPRWVQRTGQPAVAVATDPYGQRVAVADTAGTLRVFDGRGRPVGQSVVPRPLRYLAFVPEQPRLLAAADLGLVACFDAAGQLLWRDGLAAHVSALTISGDGSRILVASFGPELAEYELRGGPHRVLPQPHPCRLAALSYDGKRLLTSDRGTGLTLGSGSGKVWAGLTLPTAPVALVLAPLGDSAAVALVDGTLLGLGIDDDSP